MVWKTGSRVTASLLIAAFGLVSGSANADIFLNANGAAGFRGDATAAGYASQIDVASLQFGVTSHVAGRAQFADLTITKHVDSSSAAFAQAAASGQTLPKVIVSVTKTDASKQLVTCELTLANVNVTGYSFSDSGASTASASVETITLAYKKIDWKFSGASIGGRALTPTSGGWDVMANTKS